MLDVSVTVISAVFRYLTGAPNICWFASLGRIKPGSHMTPTNYRPWSIINEEEIFQIDKRFYCTYKRLPA